MKRLSSEALDRWTGNPCHARIQERRQIALGAGRTCTLQGHAGRQLSHRGTLRRPDRAARLVDQPPEIELLGHPAERTRIAHAPRAHRARLGEVGDRRRVCGSQQHLPRQRPLLPRIPPRLGDDAIQATVHYAFKEVNSVNEPMPSAQTSRFPLRNRALKASRTAKVGLDRPDPTTKQTIRTTEQSDVSG